MIVVDTTVLANLVLPGEATADVVRVRRLDPEWCAPLLWRSELRNVLATHVRVQQLALDSAVRAMSLAEVAMRRTGYAGESARVLELAAPSGCSAYDCEFVWLAKELGKRLVTLDRRLLECFAPMAVSPGAFLGGSA